MHIKTLILAATAALAMAGAAFAAPVVTNYDNLTAQEFGDILAGYNVNQNGIYRDDDGVEIRDLPDVDTPIYGDVTIVDKPATSDSPSPNISQLPPLTDAEAYYKGGFKNPNCGNTIAAVNADCTVLTMMPGSGGWSAVTHVENQVIGSELVDGPDVPFDVCTHNEVTDIGFNWQTGFSLEITSDTSDGTC